MALAVGTTAPSFSTTDDEGKTISLSDFAGKVVVMYFYPQDDTPRLYQRSSKLPG